MGESGSDDLPDYLEDAESLLGAWETWLAWRAGERKFLPYGGGLLEQPEGLMQSLWRLDDLYDRVQHQIKNTDPGNMDGRIQIAR